MVSQLLNNRYRVISTLGRGGFGETFLANLIDFGAVRETMGTIVNSQGSPTSSIVIGTPGFMPSEQAAGRPVYASDIYALGLTAIYLLTQKIPQELRTDTLTGEIIWREYASSISSSFAAVLETTIKVHQRDRFPKAQAMLEALQTNSASVYSNVVSSHPATIPSPSLPLVHFPTTVTPASNTSQRGIIIAGGLIGASILAGFIISSNTSKPVEEVVVQPTPEVSSTPPVPSSSNTPKPVEETVVQPPPEVSPTPQVQNPSPLPQQAIQIPQEETSSDLGDYYFVADAAYVDTASASAEVNRLRAQGYNGAGMFWIRDYPNLSNKSLYQVYPAKFRDRDSCKSFLQAYAPRHPEAYCVFGSAANPNASPDRFYAR